MTTHLVIPDTQIRDGVPVDHCDWIGQYIAEIVPDEVIHLGDHWDLKSLSYYDRHKLEGEGTRYQKDIDAGIDAIMAIMDPLKLLALKRKAQKQKTIKTRWTFCLGNHEQRIERYVEDNPELHGKLSYDDFKLEELGWHVYDFLEVVKIDGIAYSHYFHPQQSPRPYSGMMETRLKNVGFSFTMGHQQDKKCGERTLGDGSSQRGLVVGAAYLHSEKYKGPQGNSHWRGIIVKHEVEDGYYDIMEVSLNFLCKKYEGMPVKDFVREKYGIVWTAR